MYYYCCTPCTCLTIISTTDVSDNHNTSMTFQLHTYSFI